MASASGSAGKTCRRCGVDCSKLPRVKDDRGRYYCKPCYEAARREKMQRNAARAALADEAEPAAIDDGPVETADEDLRTTEIALEADSFIIGDLSDAELPTAASSAGACPGCGGALPAATVVCLACGFNRESGNRMAVAVASPERASPSTPVRRSVRREVAADDGPSGLSTAGMVVSLCGCLLSITPCIWFVGVVPDLVGLILSAVAVVKVSRGTGGGSKRAKIGLACGVLGLALWVVSFVAFGRAVSELARSLEQQSQSTQPASAPVSLEEIDRIRKLIEAKRPR